MNDQQWDLKIKEAISQAPDELPPVVREKLEAAYGSLPDRSRRRRFGRPAIWIGASVAAVIAVTFALGIVSPAMAQVLRQLPVIGTAFHTAGDVGVQRSAEGGLATSVGQTVEDQGIAITLDQVVYDGTRISVGLLHERNLDIRFAPGDSLRADGRFLNAGIGGVSKVLPDGMTASVYTFTFEDQLPDQFDLDIHFQEVTVVRDGKPETIDGNWWFETPVSKIKEGVKEKKFDPPLVREIDGIRVAVTGVTLTPLTTQISYDLEKPDRYEPSFVMGRDVPKGETVTYSGLDFQLWDEQGLMLEPLGGSMHHQPGEPEHHVIQFAPTALESHELVLRTVERQSRMRSEGNRTYVGAERPVIKYYLLPDAFPYTASQGKAGDIIFRGVTFEDDQTWVEYEVRGSDPYVQDSAWWLEDATGTEYRFDRYDQTRLREDAYVYKVKLPKIFQKANLKVAVFEFEPSKRIDKLEMNIPLD